MRLQVIDVRLYSGRTVHLIRREVVPEADRRTIRAPPLQDAQHSFN
jgi:hypothetical protein